MPSRRLSTCSPWVGGSVRVGRGIIGVEFIGRIRVTYRTRSRTRVRARDRTRVRVRRRLRV